MLRLLRLAEEIGWLDVRRTATADCPVAIAPIDRRYLRSSETVNGTGGYSVVVSEVKGLAGATASVLLALGE
jgi:hypothetical protein